jgi:GntR family transcriptional regulator/MocR family aminotransferase
MPKRTSTFLGPAFEVDSTSPTPLYRQLYDGIRSAVLRGQFRPGSRLPSTRDVAADLGVSRNTVLAAFEQLIAEGYLEGEVGAGTYVSRKLRRIVAELPGPERGGSPAPARGPSLSARGVRLAEDAARLCCKGDTPKLLRPGMPALDQFPTAVWARLAAQRAKRAGPGELWYGDPAGYRPLREAIAEYLGITRAVRCSPDQVVITAGTQQTIHVLAPLVADVGDPVWLEDPGYKGARAALLGAGVRIVPVPVDAEGIDVRAGERLCAGARAVYVTPSHQYPTGVTMSLARRIALLDWARRADAWVIEDDFDGEFCLSGRPIAALQGLDDDGRVVYAGTFSKVLHPGLGIGYAVVPEGVRDQITASRAAAGRQPSVGEQHVLASFIEQGHLARHVRAMRDLYAERQRALVSEMDRLLGDLLEVNLVQHGVYTVAVFREAFDDRAVAREALAAGVEVQALSKFYCAEPALTGLVVGHAAYAPEVIRTGVALLAAAVRRVQRRSAPAPRAAYR